MSMAASQGISVSGSELRLASRAINDNLRQVEISVPDIHCGGCVRRIEDALRKLDGVEHVRVNLSTKRVSLRFEDGDHPPEIMSALDHLGFDGHLLDEGTEEKDRTGSQLIRALAVAGFAAANIMLLSVSVWLGAEPATRDLFHWISAAIALPAIIYSGRVFFLSAWKSLRHGQTNMDVPISIGIAIAYGMSLYDTVYKGQHAYFDASVTLLFFLLIGRTLDHLTREKARTAVKGLASFAARGATVIRENGDRVFLALSAIETGMRIILPAGSRVPVDACVVKGASDVDNSLVTGESMPVSVATGSMLRAGTLNLTGGLVIEARAVAQNSFLAEMVRLMEAAEAGRGIYRRIADRASSLYAPVVHVAALLCFLGWMVAGSDVHAALTVAVAVLIITCPCALGLAVPMVQVVAAKRLFEKRIMVRDGSALERMNEIDTIVFDKTGTLSLVSLGLVGAGQINVRNLVLAQALAERSDHPCSKAICAVPAPMGEPKPELTGFVEVPGFGVEACCNGVTYRLGRATWALVDETSDLSGTVLSSNGEMIEVFHFEDVIRPDAEEAIGKLKSLGISMEILSGDSVQAVSDMALKVGIEKFSAGMLPAEKVRHIEFLKASGHKVMMVGDGLNDTPALVAAHASMAPATAADVGRNVADFVFLRDSLLAVPYTLTIARRASRLVRQNFALAILYNVIALPAALLGHVTPLAAALAMSGSSIVVVVNAMRLHSKET